MSAWKRVALESFPEWSAELEPAMAAGLSALLSSRLVDALVTSEHETAERVVRYACWAWGEGARNEPLTHIAMDVVGESLRRESLRTQLWAALPAGIFNRLVPIACGALGTDAAVEFEREYRHTVG